MLRKLLEELGECALAGASSNDSQNATYSGSCSLVTSRRWESRGPLGITDLNKHDTVIETQESRSWNQEVTSANTHEAGNCVPE